MRNDRIWLRETGSPRYAEFLSVFSYAGGRAELKISADRQYAALINGQYAANGQYADPPHVCSYDLVDVTALLHEGQNELVVIAFHSDADFALARTAEPGVSFALSIDGKIAARSGAETLCRASARYRAGAVVTPQLGYGWEYDFTAAEGGWEPCVPAPARAERPRPIRRCALSSPLPAEVAAQGIFSYRGGNTAAERAQNAWLSTLRFSAMTGEPRPEAARLCRPVTFRADEGDGVFVLVDLGRETAGYLSLSVSVKEDCDAVLVWGEHLADLRIRSQVGGRNFASALRLAAGKNELDEYLHRMGCRYLCLFAECSEITVGRLTLRASEYPFHTVKRSFDDRLLQKIYETGERTLRLCVHEHYEDCPWREQALYGMDSRNQMLFGYSVFEEYELPRAGLRLLAETARADGLLDLCAPARAAITIPAFSAYWLIALRENADADFDEPFLREMFPYALGMLEVFRAHTDGRGLYAFPEPCYWNFHEWTAGLDGDVIFRDAPIEPYGDGALTALVLIAVRGIAALALRLGETKQVAAANAYAARLAAALDGYYDEEKGLYASRLTESGLEGWHAYTQALFVLTGELSPERARRLCAELKEEKRVVPMTFASLQLKYDAILKTDGDVSFCVNEVCDVFGKMLFSGATSYWETAYGEADFDDAGSLCHGWSAVGCWLLCRCGLAKKDSV